MTGWNKYFLMAIFVPVLSWVVFLPLVLAEGDGGYVDGQVSSVDTVSSTLVVTVGGDVMAFKVPENAVILRGSESIYLMDIELSDQLGIEYHRDASGAYIATRISDANLGND